MNASRIAAIAALAAALSMAAAAPARATTVLPLYLDEIVTTSTTAFEGTVLENRIERDAATGLPVTYTTFQVTDPIKGTAGSVHTIKQVGGELADGGLNYSIRGVPKFEVGEEYVVFLAGVSAQGFSSPIGLSQGRFKVHKEGNEKRVANGRDFRDMATMPGAAPDALVERIRNNDKPVRELELKEFKELVRRKVEGGK
jgi:hypothetical protein